MVLEVVSRSKGSMREVRMEDEEGAVRKRIRPRRQGWKEESGQTFAG